MKYCSLDLELTGFDPLTDEILEIGLAFFELDSEGLRVVDKWSQTFRPKGEVHPKILGLTGITMAELQQAPLLSDRHTEIQTKLNDCIIVGHNIVFDARFLEAFGFKLSGKFIDTLDLVQFLLPTHHSYNLENLMHQFGIPHNEAHRALGDSLATIALLEQLLKRFKSFSSELQQRILDLIMGQGFLWEELFKFPFAFSSPVAASVDQEKPSSLVNTNTPALTLQPGSVTFAPFDQTTPLATAQALQADPSKYILVVSDKLSVLQLWQQGLGHGLFSPADRFDQAKFEHFLAQEKLDNDQIMFGLKVLVWFHTNWQTETIIDLNLSFFGGQFRSAISNRPLTEDNISNLICCDYETFTLLAEKQLYTDRTPVLWNAHKLEQWLSEGSQGRLTWNKVLYLLKSIYNPETNYGQVDLREPVVAALAGADLFFSLVNLEITRNFPKQQYVSYEALAANDFVFNKIQTAAQNFIQKVDHITNKSEFHELKKFGLALQDFFVDTPERVKWIEVSDINCIFVDRPLHVAPILQNTLAPYPQPAVVDNLPDTKLLEYTLARLGLFHDVANTSAQHRLGKVQLIVKEKTFEKPNIDAELSSLLTPGSLPALVALPTKAEVRDFYDRNYVALKEFAAVFAQSYSGGSNKILRNFAIRPNSILMATPAFVSRSPRTVAVRTAIIVDLPQAKADHPYVQALYNYWQTQFPGFLELQTMLEALLFFQVIYTPQLEHIYLFSVEETLSSKLQELPLFEARES
jgi:DNA polymerase III epsilon subunit-like protein